MPQKGKMTLPFDIIESNIASQLTEFVFRQRSGPTTRSRLMHASTAS